MHFWLLRQLFLDCTASSIALLSCIYKRSGKNAGRIFLRAGKGRGKGCACFTNACRCDTMIKQQTAPRNGVFGVANMKNEVFDMPYIAVSTSAILSEQQKDALKAALGERISVIPGKTEAKLMVDIADGHTMYFAGEKRALAYVDVKCFGTTEFAHKKAFTEAAFAAVQQTTGLPQDSIYLTYSEFANWGTMGSMK